MLVKDRCIGVFDLESPELDAFNKEHVEILTLLASQAAVAIENARLYEEVRSNELRIERELTFAQRVQAALLPTGLPKRLRGIDVAARFAPARELGGDLYDFLSPEANSLVVAVGDVSGKGVPAALYSAFAGELVRSRTFRRRYTPERTTPAGVLASMNTILHERRLEEYYCTLCYASFDLKRRSVTLGQRRRCRTRSGARTDSCEQMSLPGIPLGSFAGAAYDEVTFDLSPGDTYVFCTDGVSEAFSPAGEEFGTGSADRGGEEPPSRRRGGDRGRDLCRGRSLPRRPGAERRHDGGGGEVYGVTVRLTVHRGPFRWFDVTDSESVQVQRDSAINGRERLHPNRRSTEPQRYPVNGLLPRSTCRLCSRRCRPSARPPKVPNSVTLPLTRTRAPRGGTRLPSDTTVISPDESPTL